MRVKVCGTCGGADIAATVRAGADAVGFVVEYPDPVPWNLDREAAADLVAAVPPFVSSVVVTTGDPDRVCALADATRPDVVQLHGEEPPDDVAAIARRLDDRGVQTLKAVTVGPDGDSTSRREQALEYAGTGVDGLVVDAEADDRRGGGTGRTVPWDRARAVVERVDVPVLLAGGLTPENVADAVAAVDPYGVDVITGVERAHRSKDEDRMAAFVRAAKGY
jgi:phosphoribosylanthranilate isomerase